MRSSWVSHLAQLLEDLDFSRSEALLRGALATDGLGFRAARRHGGAHHGAGLVSKQATIIFDLISRVVCEDHTAPQPVQHELPGDFGHPPAGQEGKALGASRGRPKPCSGDCC